MPPLPLCLNKSEEKNETSFGNNCLHTTNWLLHVIHNIAGEWTPLELAVQCSLTFYFINNKLMDLTTKIKLRVSKSCNNSPHLSSGLADWHTCRHVIQVVAAVMGKLDGQNLSYICVTGIKTILCTNSWCRAAPLVRAT